MGLKPKWTKNRIYDKIHRFSSGFLFVSAVLLGLEYIVSMVHYKKAIQPKRLEKLEEDWQDFLKRKAEFEEIERLKQEGKLPDTS